MKKLLLITILSFIIVPLGHAGEFKLNTYYPAPFGSYDHLRLVPRDSTTLACTPDNIGMFIVEDQGNQILYCRNGINWNPLTEIWTKDGDYVYLTDDDIDLNGITSHVGIGTETPLATLHIESGGADPASLRLHPTNLANSAAWYNTSSRWDFLAIDNASEDFAIWGGYDGSDDGSVDLYKQDVLVIQGTTGNVGIGEGTPQAQLHISGNNPTFSPWPYTPQMFLQGTEPTINFIDTTAGEDNFRIRNLQPPILLIESDFNSAGFMPRMAFSRNSVGIGTYSPHATLHVNEPGWAAGTLADWSQSELDGRMIISGTSPTLSLVGEGDTTNFSSIRLIGSDDGGIGGNTWELQRELASPAVPSDASFRIYRALPEGEEDLTILPNGNVGIGQPDPQADLHVSRNRANIELGRGSLGGLASDGDLLAMDENDNITIQISGNISGAGGTNALTDHGSGVYISGDVESYFCADSCNANVGIGTTTPQGKLDVNGSIRQVGSPGIFHADYVFEDDYHLESIQEHSHFMWKNKHLKAIPPATKDSDGQEFVEYGETSKGVIEELEKAHIYIEQLHARIRDMETKLESIK